MRVIETRAAWRSACDEQRDASGCLGLVPTMGALHPGHLSLVAAARERCDAVAATIFVNPLQFGDPSDLERYPRPREADLELLEAAGCDLVFAPSVSEMYPRHPEPPTTSVVAAGAALGFEGGDRPGHFDGVVTVLTMLFSLSGRCCAFMGEKDFQQVAVTRQLVRDLELDVEVVGCPTVREADGLAMSSRNQRLDAPFLLGVLALGVLLPDLVNVAGVAPIIIRLADGTVLRQILRPNG